MSGMRPARINSVEKVLTKLIKVPFQGSRRKIPVEKVRTKRIKPLPVDYRLVVSMGQSVEGGHRVSLQYRFQGSAHQQQCRGGGRSQCGQFA
jgi:hypothetical protein